MSARPLRVLLWPPPEHANPYVSRLANALAQRGVGVRWAPRLASLCARPGDATWLHLHWPEWMLHDAVRARYLARIAWLTTLLDLARAQGLRLAWTAHNLLGHDDPHPDLGERGRRALLSRCDLALGHFASAEADLRAWGLRGAFVCVPHPPFADEHADPFADEDARRAWRRAQGIDDHHTLLVTPGSVAPYKNLPALAAALRATPDRALRWWVVGRGEGAALEALMRALGDEPRARVEPVFQTRASLSEAVCAADAVLLGHKDFYTSGAAVLASALGAPLIAPARHHLADWRDAPFFVPLDLSTRSDLTAAVARVRALPPDARDAARAHARRVDWASMAGALHRAMLEAA